MDVAKTWVVRENYLAEILVSTNLQVNLLIKSRYFEDYVLGDIRETLARTITEADITLHAAHTGDYYPHHVDAVWCRTQEFAQRVAHGTLTFSVGIGLTATNEVNPEAFSYGYDRLRFIKPVFIGDTIRARVTIAEKREYPKRPALGMIVERVEVLNQEALVVLACDHLILVKKRITS